MDRDRAMNFVRIGNAVQGADFDLTHIVKPRLPSSQVKLGHAGLHHPRLNLADYVDRSTPPPPAVHRSHFEFPWGALMNTQIGDCGEAMAIHGIEAFHLDAGTQVPPFADNDAQALYSAVGGYVPGDPSTDNGTDNTVLFNYWEQPGIKCAKDGSVHRIAHTLYVDPADQLVSKVAIWEFVALFRAIGLPLSAQPQSHWKVTDPSLKGDAAVGSWGYHDIPYLSYDQQRLRTITWGEELLVDWDFDRDYGVQGIVVVTQEMLNRTGTSPSGVDWEKLNRDVANLPPAPN